MAKSTLKSTSSGFTKEELFDNFYFVTKHALEDLESRFQIEGVADLVFVNGQGEAEAKKTLRTNNAWKILSDLYDYAVSGIDSSEDEQTSFIVTEGAEVLLLVTTHEYAPSQRWEEIVWMADGRFSLDDGESIDIRKLALLANVDVRTVRNAISAGELESFKTEAGNFVANAPARRWLHGRKGFKPTVPRFQDVRSNLSQLESPAQIAAFLVARREKLARSIGDAPAALQSASEKVEAGIFDVPLDMAFPLADFYQVPRKEFLHSVMRIFFGEQLDLLTTEAAPGQPTQQTPALQPNAHATEGKQPSADRPTHPSAGGW